MVYPVFDNEFKIGTAGRNSAAGDMKTIADMETFSVSLDNGIEEWNPMDTKGWVRRLMTAKSISITLTGKRNTGDAGNDYAFGLSLATGNAVNSKFEWVLPNGAKIAFNCVVNVTTLGGDSTNVDSLELEVMSDGAPTYSPVVSKNVAITVTGGDAEDAISFNGESVSPTSGGTITVQASTFPKSCQLIVNSDKTVAVTGSTNITVSGSASPYTVSVADSGTLTIAFTE